MEELFEAGMSCCHCPFLIGSNKRRIMPVWTLYHWPVYVYLHVQPHLFLSNHVLPTTLKPAVSQCPWNLSLLFRSIQLLSSKILPPVFRSARPVFGESNKVTMRPVTAGQPPTTDTLLYMFTVPFFILLLLGVPVPVESAIACTFEGGWSLRVDASYCPIDAPVNCGKGLQRRCCPHGLICAGEGDFGGQYCCKPGEDCTSQAASSPQVG